jgi:hypothetical protein
VEAFFDTQQLAAFANAQLADQAGYFYVLQLDPSHMPEIEEYTVRVGPPPFSPVPPLPHKNPALNPPQNCTTCTATCVKRV